MKTNSKRGFTLIETLVIVTVIGILALIAVPAYQGYTQKARLTQLQHDARLIQNAAERHYLTSNEWPLGDEITEDLADRFYDPNNEPANPDNNYYNIDMKALSRYLNLHSDPNNFAIDDDGNVYYVDSKNPVDNSNESEPIRQPEEGEIPVKTVADLQAINDNPESLSSTYILMADLDLSGVENWKPIGDYATDRSEFTGTFDGNGFVIENLKIDRPDAHYQGLFGRTGSGAKLTNIKLESASVIGRSHTGSLVGLNNGTISTSYSTGTVTGNDFTGGLVGYNDGSISTSYSTGTVTGTGYTGGLVGYNTFNGSISTSYSTGTVKGTGNTGGLVGNNSGTISTSYSTGTVNGTTGTGGLVGRNNGGGTISTSYSTSAVTGTGHHTGGLVGYNNGTISNSYWDTETSSRTNSAGGTGKTTAQMQQQATFASWDFTNTWSIDENQSYPYLIDNEQIPHPGIMQ